MDHVVYTDAKSEEMEKLVSGQKKIIIRGATGRKMPYGRVHEGDVLYLLNNNAEGVVKATCTVAKVFNSEKMTAEESIELVDKNAKALYLSEKQYKKWAGKRYLILIHITDAKLIEKPFSINKDSYGNMDDWLHVEDINNVMK